MGKDDLKMDTWLAVMLVVPLFRSCVTVKVEEAGTYRAAATGACSTGQCYDGSNGFCGR